MFIIREFLDVVIARRYSSFALAPDLQEQSSWSLQIPNPASVPDLFLLLICALLLNVEVTVRKVVRDEQQSHRMS